MERKKIIILLIFVIGVASFLRLYNIDETPPGLYPDEAMNGNNVLEVLATGEYKVFYPENNGREGLFMNIQALSVYIFGNEPWALRGVSALFGILTVLGLYFLTKELFSCEIIKIYESAKVKIALLSSFFLATSFWHILFSRIGFRAIMAPFFLTWGIYFLLLALRQIKEQKTPKFYIMNSIFSGILYGLGFHSYIAYRATPILVLIIIALHWLQNKNWQIRKKILLSTCCFLLAAFVVAAPLGLYFLNNPQDFMGRTTQVSVFSSPSPLKDLSVNILKTAGMFNFSGDYNWRHNYAGKPLLFWPVGILFLIGILLGLRMFFEKASRRPGGLREEYSQAFLVLFSWLIIAALPVIVSNEGIPHALRAILMAPAVFILAGVGGVWLMEKIKNPRLPIKIFNFTLSFYVLIFTFCIWLIFNAYNSYFIKWGKSEHIAGAFAAEYVKIGRELNTLPKELPKYVVVETGGVLVRGIPMPTQTIMFITNTFTPEKQKEKNIYYVLPEQKNQIPENSYQVILR
ncbi:MAG: glycosyltransferase family 39 protein [Patescibacteria group bacterium]|mgnify:CR=1 FL=1